MFWPDFPSERVPEIPPFIAIEVLSPEDRLSDLRRRFAEYAALGVRHIWMADPETRTFSVYDGQLRDTGTLDLPELQLSVTPGDIFPA